MRFCGFQKQYVFNLIQVCEQLHNENKDREIKGLIEAMDFFTMKEGIIITKNQKDTISIKNYKINLIPANEFIMSGNR
jgi:uncharacterized protein